VSGRSLVGFCGSRAFVSGGHPFVASVVGEVVRACRGVAVGCACGVDAAVLRSRLALPFPSSSSGSQLVVFAVGGPVRGRAGLFGFWRSSAVSLVQAASRLAVSPGHGCWAPVSVCWWAGGSGPLVSRLRARSLALVRSVAASGPRAGLVAFVGGGWAASPGSWVTLRAAVLAGLPVVVFPFLPVSPSGVRWGFSSAPRGFRSLPSLARWCGPGRWVRAGSGPVWGLGWRWVPGG